MRPTAARSLRTALLGIAAVLTLAHGAVHLWWLAPPSPEAAALVDPRSAWATQAGLYARFLEGVTLVLAPTIVALYAASAAGLLGWLLGPAAWRRVTIAASALSLALLTLYFDPAGWVGFAVDVGLIAALVTPLPARLGIPRTRGRPA